MQKHYEWKDKFEIASRAKVSNKEELSLAYTPGVVSEEMVASMAADAVVKTCVARI